MKSPLFSLSDTIILNSRSLSTLIVQAVPTSLAVMRIAFGIPLKTGSEKFQAIFELTLIAIPDILSIALVYYGYCTNTRQAVGVSVALCLRNHPKKVRIFLVAMLMILK
uniref:Uncharacterized protein n=1 Tax=Glossina austeni TaxID=7395 RepID=A0A1A9VBI3_GLOAU